MTPKDGKPGIPLTPLEPKAVEEADSADPGEVSEAKALQLETQSGKYGAVKVKAFKPPPAEEGSQQQRSWIEIELVGEDDKPIAGEAYEIVLPDQSVATGTLDHKGFARVEGFEPGTCKVSFPDLDQDAWEPI